MIIRIPKILTKIYKKYNKGNGHKIRNKYTENSIESNA